MKIRFEKSALSGSVSAPPSKSLSHRYLFGAALAEGESVIHNLGTGEDIDATVRCLSALGAKIERDGKDCRVVGIGKLLPAKTVLNCSESGSTLRFLIPLLWNGNGRYVLAGQGRLPSRPLSVYEEIAEKQGLILEKKDGFFTVEGKLNSGEFSVRGDISSQMISGLLFALARAEGNSKIRILPPFESASYVDLTLAVLSDFGVKIEKTEDFAYFIPGGQTFRCGEFFVEGDQSNGAYLSALSHSHPGVRVEGLNPDSLQGDRVFAESFEQIDAGSPVISVKDCPDLAPIFMALGALKNGCVLTDTKRLSMKESDRGQSMAEELCKFGADVCVKENEIAVKPAKFHAPRVPLDGHGDHRVVMALSALLTVTGGELEGAEAVGKSFPDYFDVLKKLGSVFEVIA